MNSRGGTLLDDGVDRGQHDERLVSSGSALRRARRAWRCAGRWFRRWAPRGRKARRPRRGSSAPRRRARRSASASSSVTSLVPSRATCRIGWRPRRSRRRAGQARRAGARRGPSGTPLAIARGVFSSRSTGKEGSLGVVGIDCGSRSVSPSGEAMETPEPVDQFVEVGSPSEIAFQHATFDRRVRAPRSDARTRRSRRRSCHRGCARQNGRAGSPSPSSRDASPATAPGGGACQDR